MVNSEALESRPPLHEPESGFGLTLGDLGGVSRWSRSDMLGEERSKQRMNESIGVFRAEGWMCEDPETSEAYIGERVDGTGRRLIMSDILPTHGLGGAVEVEIIIRARELPEHDEVRVDTSKESPSIPLWNPRG